MPLDPKRVQAAFLAAVEHPDPAGRAEALDRECSGDAELRRRVEALLRAHDGPGRLLDGRRGTPVRGRGADRPAPRGPGRAREDEGEKFDGDRR